MSELSKLLESKLPVANPANLANPYPKISNFSNFSRGARPRTHFDRQSLQSVDTLRRKLLRERRGELKVQAAGDWDEIKADIGKLLAFADLEAIRQIRESGNCPDTYTAKTTCRNCGEVPIFEGCPPQVNGCPWCLNRHAGLPMPKEKN